MDTIYNKYQDSIDGVQQNTQEVCEPVVEKIISWQNRYTPEIEKVISWENLSGVRSYGKVYEDDGDVIYVKVEKGNFAVNVERIHCPTCGKRLVVCEYYGVHSNISNN